MFKLFYIYVFCWQLNLQYTYEGVYMSVENNLTQTMKQSRWFLTTFGVGLTHVRYKSDYTYFCDINTYTHFRCNRETAAVARLDFDASVLLIFLSADSQEEAGIHQEQAFPQEGQETDQEIFIGSPTPTEAHCGRERGKIFNTKLSTSSNNKSTNQDE